MTFDRRPEMSGKARPFFMKRLLLALVSIAVANATAAPFITIGDLKLFQAYAPAESPVGLREYIPVGESIDKWTHLASLRVIKDQKDPEAYLTEVATQVAKSNPAARYQFLRNDKTKSLILDFMMFPPASTSPFYAEWNLMRATFVAGKGLVVYQYAIRIFEVGPQTGAIVNAERNKMVGPFERADFAETDEADKAPPGRRG